MVFQQPTGESNILNWALQTVYKNRENYQIYRQIIVFFLICFITVLFCFVPNKIALRNNNFLISQTMSFLFLLICLWMCLLVDKRSKRKKRLIQSKKLLKI